MSKTRPPDILRKSHRHVEGNERARAKEELRRKLEDDVDADEADDGADPFDLGSEGFDDGRDSPADEATRGP
jgi:hypothetical protein